MLPLMRRDNETQQLREARLRETMPRLIAEARGMTQADAVVLIDQQLRDKRGMNPPFGRTDLLWLDDAITDALLAALFDAPALPYCQDRQNVARLVTMLTAQNAHALERSTLLYPLLLAEVAQGAYILHLRRTDVADRMTKADFMVHATTAKHHAITTAFTWHGMVKMSMKEHTV